MQRQAVEDSSDKPTRIAEEMMIASQLAFIVRRLGLELVCDPQLVYEAHPDYPEALRLLHVLPPEKLCKYDELGDEHSIAMVFAESDFVEGLQYLKDHSSKLTSYHPDRVTPFWQALRNPGKRSLDWLIKWHEDNHAPFAENRLQHALLKKNTSKFKRLLETAGATLPGQGGLIDLLTVACLMGNHEAIKHLCEFNRGRYLSQLNTARATEACVYIDNHESFFYLLDISISKGNLLDIMLQFMHMLESELYKAADVRVENAWFYRKPLVERIISWLLQHPKLNDAEKSALLKIPVMYLLSAYPYEEDSFQIVFAQALALLDKKIPATEMIKMQMSASVYYATANTFSENPLKKMPMLHHDFAQAVKIKLFNDLKPENLMRMRTELKYFIYNLKHHDNFEVNKLFGPQFAALFRHKIQALNCYFLYDYVKLPQEPYTFTIPSHSISSAEEWESNALLLRREIEWNLPIPRTPDDDYILRPLRILLDSLITFHNRKLFPESRLLTLYSNLNSLIYISNDHNLFNNDFHADTITDLLQAFLSLGLALGAEDYPLIKELMPLFLRYCRPEIIQPYLKIMIQQISLPDDSYPNLAVNQLTIMASLILNRLQIKPIRPQDQEWFIRGDAIMQIGRITVYSLMQQHASIISEATALQLIDDIKDIQLADLRKAEIKIAYLLECMILTDTLTHWCAQAGSDQKNASIFTLKELIFSKLYSLLKSFDNLEIQVDEKHQKEWAALMNGQASIKQSLQDAIQANNEARQAYLHRFRPQADARFNAEDYVETTSHSLTALNALTRLRPRLFQAKPLKHERHRALDALHLEGRMTTIRPK